MVRCVLVILLLLLVQPTLYSHGSNAQPPPGEWEGDPPLPPDVPFRPPTPPEDPDGGGGKPPTRPPIRPTIRPGRRTTGGSGSSWLIWWEMNREHLIGMRKILREHGTTTTGSGRNTVDPMAARRAEALVVLRKIARGNDKRTVRASAILALGRMGDEGDAEYFMEVLGDSAQSYLVRDAAAIALGILPIADDDTGKRTRATVRNKLRFFMQVPRRLPKRTRGLVLLSAGLRGREDPALVMSILLRLGQGRKLQAEDAANVVYACGLSNDPIAAPELIPIVRKGMLGTNRAGEMPRSHAALALGRCDERGSVPILALVVTSRSAGVNTRRSAALALGRLLREADLERDRARMAERALRRIFEKGRDPVVRGFAALGLGGSKEPAGILELKTAIDHGGNADIKPYCALALGLAARTLDDRRGRALRTFLREEFSKTKERDLSAALALGLGIAGDKAATDDLLEQLELRRLTARQRGGAAQALGLIRSNNPAVAKALEKVLREERNPELLGDAALALGLMGRRGVVKQLLDLLESTKSSRVQARICLSLGHLDAAGSVAPLLEILQDTKRRTLVREFAAVALGIMGDRREADPLFALDCYFNFLATTLATNEITRLY